MQQGPMAQKGRHTRTRNGCQRCRARRRKCDEARPQCQRCVDAGAHCDYAKQFLFRNQQQDDQAECRNDAPRPESLNPPRQGGDDTITLLQYYQRHVAPWLDMFDNNKAFGRLVPRVATTSSSVLDAILQLAACASPDAARDSIASGAPLALQALGNLANTPLDPALSVIIVFALQKAQLFVEMPPDNWESVFPYGGADPDFIPDSFRNPEHSRVHIAFGILLCRLSLAHALIHEAAPAVDSRVLHKILEAVKPTECAGISTGEMDRYECLVCLALSLDVMVLCFERPKLEDQSSSPPPALRRDEAWTMRWDTLQKELRTWYQCRPANLQALIEADKIRPGGVFPSVFFSDDAGAWANMMYHVAMHVLISHRPKSSHLAASRAGGDTRENGMHMSYLWHAHRLCAIALTTDQECWDPCMIAAFWLCGQRMTHPDQQKEIIWCLRRLCSTKWRHVGTLESRLRDDFFIPEDSLSATQI